MRLFDAIAQNTLPKGPNCQLPSQSSNQSPTLEPGTEFFDAETGARIRHILRDFTSRDRIPQRI
jgi:hypothetical protein